MLDRHGSPLLAVLALTGVAAGMAGMRPWLTRVQFAHRTSFGRRDPQFHPDLSFYVFVYPFLRLVLGHLFAAVLLALVAAVIVHAVDGGLPGKPPTWTGNWPAPAARSGSARCRPAATRC